MTMLIVCRRKQIIAAIDTTLNYFSSVHRCYAIQLYCCVDFIVVARRGGDGGVGDGGIEELQGM